MRCCFFCPVALGAVLLIGTAGIVACSTSTKSESKPMAAASTKPINTMCVMNPHDEVDPDVTSDFKGQKVGFCCSKCKAKWDKMSDADKDARLKAAAATR